MVAFWPLLAHPTWVVYDGHADTIEGHLPYRILMADAVRAGQGLPRYDPTAFGGIPLAGDPQTGFTYPPNWLHALSGEGGPEWFGWLMALHVVVAGFGVLFWLRPHGFGQAACFAAAVAFMLSGKWFHHTVASGHAVLLPLAWLPWQLGGIDRLWAGPRLRQVAGLAATTGLIANGTHPQLLVYSQFLVFAYALCRFGGPRPVASLGALSAAAVLGLGLGALHLLPTTALLDEFVRGSGLSYASAASHAISPAGLLRLLVEGPRVAFSNDVLFIGSAALGLSLVAFGSAAHRRVTLFFVVALLVCVVYAMGEWGGFHPLIHRFLPDALTFRRPARVLVLAGLPIAWGVAAGVEVLHRGTRAPGRIALAGVLGLASLPLFVLAARTSDLRALSAALGFALPAAALLASLEARVWPQRRVAAVWIAVLVAQSLLFAAPLVEVRPFERILPRSPIAASIRAPFGEGRVLALNTDAESSMPLDAARNAIHGLEGVRGYNPLIPLKTLRVLAAAQHPHSVAILEDAARIPIRTLGRRQPLDAFNVRWIVSDRPLALDALRFEAEVPALDPPEREAGRPTRFVYENRERMPRAALVRRARPIAAGVPILAALEDVDLRSEVLVGESLSSRSYPGAFRAVDVDHRGDALSMDVDAGAGAFLVISELAYRGWRARVNGNPAPIHRANGVFQAIELGPGRHVVELSYRPREWEIGLALTTVSLLVVAALWIADRRRSGPDSG